MARTYPNERTGARHTYRFYKERRNDPKWRDTFLEVRSIRRWETFFTIVILILLAMIGLVLFGDKIFPDQSGTESFISDNTKPEQSSTGTPESDETKPEQSNTESSHSTRSSSDTVKDYIVGKGFRVNPILYDGVDTTQAMNENLAPQNLAHDGIELLLFKDESTVTMKGVPSYFFPHDEQYTISDQFIMIGQLQIPYQVAGDKVEFQTWTSKDQEHTITWQIEPDNTVEESIREAEKVKEETEANLNN